MIARGGVCPNSLFLHRSEAARWKISETDMQTLCRPQAYHQQVNARVLQSRRKQVWKGFNHVDTCGKSRPRVKQCQASAASTESVMSNEEKLRSELLIVQAARGQQCPRAPVWMMRQAGRYMQSYRDLAEKHPSFRERSETVDLAVEITLQPFKAFQPDGAILFSDILTPLPALGLAFEIDDAKGPIMESTVRNTEDLKQLHALDATQVSFVGDALRILRKELPNGAGGTALLGFVGSPWTLATYVVEGKTSRLYQVIKSMIFDSPQVLDKLLSHLAENIAMYLSYQADNGADYVQIFDSWGGQLPPYLWSRWSGPYIKQMISAFKEKHPSIPVALYMAGSGGLLERMQSTGADVIALDWSIDLADARERLGADQALQGNVDPVVLLGSQKAIEEAVRDVVKKGGHGQAHVLNLGHGVLPQTPEENVAYFFDLAKSM